ncbi:unnamed protein product [Nesidiocoris tenuis]|uniref:Uncharacterized protein n=1 Tax=Nesidiocoris tenuis TaxID=355587 RepID=A0A6H5GQD1_9HEMI|nr:unnamed protein product [Nesidiocoris tenuis]
MPRCTSPFFVSRPLSKEYILVSGLFQLNTALRGHTDNVIHTHRKKRIPDSPTHKRR